VINANAVLATKTRRHEGAQRMQMQFGHEDTKARRNSMLLALKTEAKCVALKVMKINLMQYIAGKRILCLGVFVAINILTLRL
jgi:hypothetical protein